jgi:glycosyltransferase involved in cell wall biosynthesis
MHVAINAWFWDRPDTGSGQYVHRLVHFLRRIEPSLAITLIMPPHNPTPHDVPKGVNVLTSGNRATSNHLGKVWFEQRTFPRLAEKAQATVAHVPYWGSPLVCNLPVVVSVLDMIPILYPLYAMGTLNRLYQSLVSTSARNATHIITISHTSALDIEKFLGIPRPKISVTYLAPDDQFHPHIGKERDAQVKQKYNLPDKFILYLGGYDRRKQVNELLLSYTYIMQAEGANFPLVLAGKEPTWGSSAVFPDMRQYAQELNIQDDIRWIGFVDEADKASLYRLASVFVFPSEYEGFGLPPLEAMACGTPVVAWDSDVFDEIFEESAYLTDSSRKMAGAIIALLLQEEFRNTMINQGLAHVTNFNWRKTAKATLEVYQRVVNKAK